MKRLISVSADVKFLLENQPETRNSDSLLYVEVCKLHNPTVHLFPFGAVMANPKVYDLPQFESVRRARQKVQAENEHLKANKTVKEYRAENELKYKAFALDMQYE